MVELSMSGKRRSGSRVAIGAIMGGAACALVAGSSAPGPVGSLAIAAAPTARLPNPPADGVIGFVVEHFVPAVLQGKDACPHGLAKKNREIYLDTLAPPERERLLRKENEQELSRLWKSSVVRADGTNLCSQPDAFDRPLVRTVQSRYAIGLDLDDDRTGRGGASSCSHENFRSPQGEEGIDNQAYRVMGCTQEWRGTDGIAGDIVRGMNQFHASGEWTQVILLRGVDSLVRDDSVEVIYANTIDRPAVDSSGKFLRGVSFTVSDQLPRHRNVLQGSIVNGVLTTKPADIKLSQTWGQSRGRGDIRGHRTTFDLRQGRLRLTFQSDGGLIGLVGGYQPVWNLIQSPSIGGLGGAQNAGIDCAGTLKTLKALADGIRDPQTGRCAGVSSALELRAVPAFVTDSSRAAARRNIRNQP
jgi:hypothetical protein